MTTIFDIAQLAPLRTIADRKEIKLELHGGVVFRLALQPANGRANAEKPVDLFDLAPFTADVDLLHSGPTDETKVLFEAILRVVPNADCFRWEVRSQSAHREFREAAEFDHQIPARRLSLTADGISDPLGGIEDIRAKRFRFIFRETFDKSPLFLRGRSLEVFPALLYLQTLFEADLSDSEWFDQPGLHDALAIFERAASARTERALEQSPYLRTRLAYLLINCLGAAQPSSSRLLENLLGFNKFLAWLSHTDFPISSDLKDYLNSLIEGTPLVLSPSSQLRGDSDRHRLPFVTKAWSEKDAAHEMFSRFPFSLAPGQTILTASPTMHLGWGDAVCPQEFVYFALPENSASFHVSQFRDEDLSMVAVVREWWKKGWPFSSRHMYSIPCVVQKRPSKISYAERAPTLLIRANMMNLYNILARFPGADTQFFLVGSEQ